MEQVTYSELCIEVADYLGLGRDPDLWENSDKARIASAVRDGYRLFLYPPPLTPGGKSHRWTFLTPSAVLTTEAGKATYDLPSNFAHLASGLAYEEYPYPPIQITSEYYARQVSKRSANGLPRYACLYPVIPSGTDPIKWEMLLAPTPNGEYKLRYKYVILTTDLSEESPYPICGPQHGPTLILACRAQAEISVNREPGAQWQAFMVRLAASISQDQQGGVEIVPGSAEQAAMLVERYVTVGGKLPS